MKTAPKQKQLSGLAVALLATFAAGAIGALASVEAKSFYAQLARPDWAPPDWLFGPVWTVLYFMMGVAAWLVWRVASFRAARAAFILFALQLVANALWSWLFFGWRRGALAFAEVLLLWALIAATVMAFWRWNVLAGMLMLPYLAWVTFASALTFSVWQRNPGLL